MNFAPKPHPTMHLQPSPAVLCVAHDGTTIKTADVLFTDYDVNNWTRVAQESGFKTWRKPLHEVTRECGAFEPMREALLSCLMDYSHNTTPIMVSMIQQAISIATPSHKLETL